MLLSSSGAKWEFVAQLTSVMVQRQSSTVLRGLLGQLSRLLLDELRRGLDRGLHGEVSLPLICSPHLHVVDDTDKLLIGMSFVSKAMMMPTRESDSLPWESNMMVLDVLYSKRDFMMPSIGAFMSVVFGHLL